mmetsp:Transcript_12830/g.28918  ORF Transcript_12830/g.28918 Transcript_12830/m.28918 type:complete len:212 (-) Transcript_12830:417-1052(-)
MFSRGSLLVGSVGRHDGGVDHHDAHLDWGVSSTVHYGSSNLGIPHYQPRIRTRTHAPYTTTLHSNAPSSSLPTPRGAPSSRRRSKNTTLSRNGSPFETGIRHCPHAPMDGRVHVQRQVADPGFLARFGKCSTVRLDRQFRRRRAPASAGEQFANFFEHGQLSGIRRGVRRFSGPRRFAGRAARDCQQCTAVGPISAVVSGDAIDIARRRCL